MYLENFTASMRHHWSTESSRRIKFILWELYEIFHATTLKMKMKVKIKIPSSNEDIREDLKELWGLLLWIYQTGIPVT
jgi:hypothetical protein